MSDELSPQTRGKRTNLSDYDLWSKVAKEFLKNFRKRG
jgi:hypothetical protein